MGKQSIRKWKNTSAEELANLATLKSGDLVEVELEIDSKNDYEYLHVRRHESRRLRAGRSAQRLQRQFARRVHGTARQPGDVLRPLRLARGKHSVSYRLRAETPGQFSALPAVASAMYAPELKANSDEIKLKISD